MEPLTAPFSSSVSGQTVPRSKSTSKYVRAVSGAAAGQKVLRAAHSFASSGNGLPSPYEDRCVGLLGPLTSSALTSHPGAKTPAAESGSTACRTALGASGCGFARSISCSGATTAVTADIVCVKIGIRDFDIRSEWRI